MSKTYKTNDVKEYIELANILLEESEMKLVEQFNDFYAQQSGGRELDELVVVEIWQGLNDTHELLIDMMKFYANFFNEERITYQELEQYKTDVTEAFNGFILNMVSNNHSEYYYGEHERPRMQGIHFGMKLVKDEILAKMENSLLP